MMHLLGSALKLKNPTDYCKTMINVRSAWSGSSIGSPPFILNAV